MRNTTFKQFLKHLHLWWITSPFHDLDPHLWIGKLGSTEFTCQICGATKIEEKDEEEIEQDKRIQEAFSCVDWGSLEDLEK